MIRLSTCFDTIGPSSGWYLKCINAVHTPCGPDSSVRIATGYGLDGPGIESRWRRDFPHLSRPALGHHPASCTMRTLSFPGVKNGRDVTLTHPLLVPWPRKSRAIPLLPPWAVRSVQSLSACTTVHCSFTYLTVTAIPLLPLWAVRPVQSVSACTRARLYLYLLLLR